jgi:hypothetical protein
MIWTKHVIFLYLTHYVTKTCGVGCQKDWQSTMEIKVQF